MHTHRPNARNEIFGFISKLVNAQKPNFEYLTPKQYFLFLTWVRENKKGDLTFTCVREIHHIVRRVCSILLNKYIKMLKNV